MTRRNDPSCPRCADSIAIFSAGGSGEATELVSLLSPALFAGIRPNVRPLDV
jgi:hypothetical protein